MVQGVMGGKRHITLQVFLNELVLSSALVNKLSLDFLLEILAPIEIGLWSIFCWWRLLLSRDCFAYVMLNWDLSRNEKRGKIKRKKKDWMKTACLFRTYLNRAYLALGFYQLIMCSKDTYLTNYLFTYKFGVCTDENYVQIYKTAISLDLWKQTHLGVLYWAPKHAVISGLDARSNTPSHIKPASATYYCNHDFILIDFMPICFVLS